MANTAIDKRIERARASLAANLGELQARVTRAREMVSPRTYLGSPWLKVGVGVAIGFLVGRRRKKPTLLLTDGTTEPAKAKGLVGAALRTAVTSLVGAAIERAVEHFISAKSEPDEDETEADEETEDETEDEVGADDKPA